MNNFDRRSALGVLASAAVIPCTTAAQTSAGKELAPGVRQIDYGERDPSSPRTRKYGCVISRFHRALIRPNAI